MEIINPRKDVYWVYYFLACILGFSRGFWPTFYVFIFLLKIPSSGLLGNSFIFLMVHMSFSKQHYFRFAGVSELQLGKGRSRIQNLQKAS